MARVNDPHRPEYHFLPPANWMNDPNGLIQFRGEYHLFYQYNPQAPVSANKHWGHAVSHDLVHWEHWPIALAPTPGGPDKDGCYSGCAVVQGGLPTLVYTGVHPEVQCIATSADGMRTWRKYEGNPVIGGPPEDVQVTGFRDPCVWQEGETWCMLVGSGLEGVGGAALLYRSEDLRRWEYLEPLCVGDVSHTGRMWECPDLFPLRHKHVLVISAQPLRRSLYFVGSYGEERFVPENRGIVDAGGHFYAPQTLLDDQGRRLMWGWIWEGRSKDAQIAAGWAGVMSLPRMLSLRPSGTLGWQVAPELQALRGSGVVLEGIAVPPDEDVPLRDVRGEALELHLRFAPAAEGLGACGLSVRCAPRGQEETRIEYLPAEGRLTIDRTRASLSEDTVGDVRSGDLQLGEGEGLDLHVYLDHSVLEVIANGCLCMTSRIYPELPDSVDVRLHARGRAAEVQSLQAWRMGSIW